MSATSQSLPIFARHLFTATGKALRRLFPGPRHPNGFYVVCMAVFFERWAAYMLGSSVVLMFCERYGYARGDALRLAGLVNAASYLGTLPGGLAVDRTLGSRRSFAVGMVLLALGYAALTLSASAALWLSLGLLVVGHALFKPSTQSVIVSLYAPSDTRRDAAQIVFYLAVNAGATVGAVLTGLLVRSYNWRVTFALAAGIMLAGCMLFALSDDTLQAREKGPFAPSSEVPIADAMSAWQQAKIIGALTLAVMLYTVGLGQVEGSLFLWAQDRTDRVLFGFEIPAAWFVGLPAFLVLILAPLQLALLPRIQRRIDTPRLIAAGLVAVALAFVVLIPPAIFSDGHRVSMGWLIGCMTLLVVGELLVAPLGLSLLVRLAPPRFVGVVVGAWYVSGALGFWLAGELGAIWFKWVTVLHST